MIYLISTFIALACAAIESVSYIGFIHNHTGIRAYVFYFASVGLIYFSKTYPAILARLLRVIAYTTSLLYIILIFAETITYPNFVFTTTHINPFSFKIFIVLIWIHTMVINKFSFVKSLLLASLIFAGVDGAARTLGLMYLGLKDIALLPFATYQEKMAKVYPGFYPAMQEIKKLTPPDATILLPPQGSPWDKEGNAAFVTYFLYPRSVKNLIQDDVASYAKDNHYILISHGIMSMFTSSNMYEYGWPKIPIKAKNMWKISLDSNTIETYSRDFNPQTDQWDWGLIEVKYE
jgi:hypothetical protein